MTGLRMTMTTRMVLQALHAAGQPLYGLEIAQATGLGTGTVYPILHRLEQHGRVHATDETSPHPGRPPRRYYQPTLRGEP
ncbi:PadR family transcriptional regulator [Streptomyces zhihengii]|uniref:PadR family transcriptional regulator n=1 Tax=Streptomyces zhihengii TaxID=1818004 RepID=UPI0036414A96